MDITQTNEEENRAAPLHRRMHVSRLTNSFAGVNEHGYGSTVGSSLNVHVYPPSFQNALSLGACQVRQEDDPASPLQPRRTLEEPSTSHRCSEVLEDQSLCPSAREVSSSSNVTRSNLPVTRQQSLGGAPPGKTNRYRDGDGPSSSGNELLAETHHSLKGTQVDSSNVASRTSSAKEDLHLSAESRSPTSSENVPRNRLRRFFGGFKGKEKNAWGRDSRRASHAEPRAGSDLEFCGAFRHNSRFTIFGRSLAGFELEQIRYRSNRKKKNGAIRYAQPTKMEEIKRSGSSA